jgi:hypothetical protein
MRIKRSQRNYNSLMYKLRGARDGNYLPCNNEVFEKGEIALVLYGPRSFIVEVWVVHISRASNIKMDWNIASGRPHIRYLGDGNVVMNTINKFLPALKEITRETTGYDLIVY